MSALPKMPLVLESLETRRLLAVNFDFTIIDPGGSQTEFHDDVQRTIEAAGTYWSQHFDSNVTLQVDVMFEFDPFDNWLAQAGPYDLEPVDEVGDVEIVELGSVHEIRTGTDPNGGTPDAFVIINTNTIDDLFFDPAPLTRTAPIPVGEFDALSILMHELGHVVGFLGLKDDFTGEVRDDRMTTYDQFVAFTGPTTVIWTGENGEDVYGQPPPLSLGSISHYGNENGPGQDLDGLMMSPSIGFAERVSITPIDLAILLDMGLPVIFDGGVIPTPPVPPTLDVSGTPKSDIIEVIYTGNLFLVNVTNKVKVQQNNPFTGLPEVVDKLVTARYQFSSLGFTDIIIRGEAGDDKIIVNNDMVPAIIWGGSGNDTITGGFANDTIFGEAGNDQIFGGNGHDRLDGGGGEDYLVGGFGNDRMFGNTGHDILDASAGNDRLWGGPGNDMLLGGREDDHLLGEEGNDQLYGNDGRDRLDGGVGGDHLEGGPGVDSADYQFRLEDLMLTLNETADDGEAGEGDNITFTTENIWAGLGNDKISGNGQNNVLAGNVGQDFIDGGSGDDVIEGGDGADVIDGMTGDDTLDGGAGDDRIQGNAGRDLILGGQGNDRLFAVDLKSDTLNGGAGTDLTDVDELDIIEDAGL